MKKQWVALLLALGMVFSLETAAVAVPSAGTAYASTQNVAINGATVEFQAYALKDENGFDTNYVKVRDVALALDGTTARFNVGWDGAVNLETGKPYTTRNGQENQTPYTGNRPYTSATATTKVNGVVADLDAFILLDDNGGASTYYKLRDLGQVLGFTVDWTAERGIYIETKCEHKWSEATCTEPKTCLLCGETEGTMLEHRWVAATCDEPSQCQVCGKTRGEANGHDWTEAGCVTLSKCRICGKTRGIVPGHDWRAATCTRPATCAVCGETQGVAAGHKWIDATYDEPKTCRVCGATSGEPLERGPSKMEQYLEYKQTIDEKIAAIKAEGDLYYGSDASYRSEVSSLTSQIASAQSRINTLSLSTDRRDQAECRQYETQLESLQNELDELQAAYGRKQQVDALRTSLDNYYNRLMSN